MQQSVERLKKINTKKGFSIQSSAEITVKHTHTSHYPKTWKQIWRQTQIYSFTCAWLTQKHPHSPRLSNTLLCYLSPIILIRFGGFTIGLWSYITQHSSTLIDWISSSCLYPTFPFSSYFYILWHHIIQQHLYLLAVIEREILNIVLDRTNRLSEMATMHLKNKESNINFCKKVCTDVLNEPLGPSEKSMEYFNKENLCCISTKRPFLSKY